MVANNSRLYDTADRLLQPISVPLGRVLSLPHLPAYFPTMALAFLSFQLLEVLSAPFLSYISPKYYGRANARSKHNWVVHVVSTVHASLIIPIAILCLNAPELDNDRAFAFNPRAGHLHAVACGFLWDTLDNIFHYTSTGFVIHGLVCLMVYGQAFRPFLGYYGPRFLLWELSTPFLNIHWFLDKTNRTGGTLQIVNGIILLAMFFFARLCYGGLMSVRFFYTLQEVKSEIPVALAVAYAIGNLSLQFLNWFWFSKMLLAMKKRFSTKQPRPGNAKGHSEGNNKRVE